MLWSMLRREARKMLTKMMCNSIASQFMTFKGTERLLDSTAGKTLTQNRNSTSIMMKISTFGKWLWKNATNLGLMTTQFTMDLVLFVSQKLLMSTRLKLWQTLKSTLVTMKSLPGTTKLTGKGIMSIKHLKNARVTTKSKWLLHVSGWNRLPTNNSHVTLVKVSSLSNK